MAVFPIFWVLGHPWKWRKAPPPRAFWGKTATGVAILAGIAGGWLVGLNVLFAASWSLLFLWFLNAFALGANRKLVLLPLLGFPWVASDLYALDRYLRISEAAVLDWVYFALGLTVRREGISLEIEGMPLYLDESISGIHLFQAMMLVGFVLVFLKVPAGVRSWWALGALIPLAWLVNVARLLLMGTIALSTTPHFAAAWSQRWGACLAICLMAVLSHGLFVWIATCSFKGEGPVRWE